MPKFRKRPDSNIYEVEQFFDDQPLPFRDAPACYFTADKGWYVITAHGQETPIANGDWIMPEPDGRGFYPIKPDIFADRYEPADQKGADVRNREDAFEQKVQEMLELVEKERKGCDWRDFDSDDTPWGGFEWACERIYEAIADRFTKIEAHDAEITELKQIVTAPIDMIIFCPSCHKQHIDRPDEVCGSKVFDLTCRRLKHHTGPCSTADEKAAWANPVHKSHTCRSDDGGCGIVFRVADVPTNGVKNIQTKGENDTWAIHVQSSGD